MAFPRMTSKHRPSNPLNGDIDFEFCTILVLSERQFIMHFTGTILVLSESQVICISLERFTFGD